MTNSIIILGIVLVFVFRRLRKSSQNNTQKKALLIAEIVAIIFVIAQFPFAQGFINKFRKENAGYSSSATSNLTEEETRNIAISISKCWGISAKESNLPSVNIYVFLNPDASIQNIHVIDAEKERYKNDAIFRKTADRAMNALKACPLTFFPKEKYEAWKEMELVFDPKMGAQPN